MAKFEVEYTSIVLSKKADEDGNRTEVRRTEGKVLVVEATSAAKAREAFVAEKGEHPTHVREITNVTKVEAEAAA